MRAFCAIMGALTVPVVYAIMRESGYPILIAAFSASLVLFGKSRTKHLAPLARSLKCKEEEGVRELIIRLRCVWCDVDR